MLRLNLLVACLLLCACLPAQTPLTGRVTDAQGEALAFVSILMNDDPGQGVLTDIEGRFQIEARMTVQSLTFRYLGFESLRLSSAAWAQDPTKPLRIVLQAADMALPEATIRAGENPADILIRRAIAHRKENNPELRRGYQCTTYNKMVLEALPRRHEYERRMANRDSSKSSTKESREQFDQLEKSMQEHHAFLMESVTERSFLFPNQVQERVRLNRVSGFRNAGLVALANQVQPFTFYGDYLTLLDKNYVNPISPGSPALYFFNIEDTLYAGPDTVWVISFHPRKGKVFEALQGVLHLNSKHWAIQNVRAEPAVTGNVHLKIEQAYQFWPADSAGGQWFPAQLNFEMEFRNYPAPFLGLRASGRSYLTDVTIDPPLRQRDFNEELPILFEPGAQTQADSNWQPWRQLAPLQTKESSTYQWLDSLGSSRRFDRLSTLMDVLSTGRLPLGRSPLSIDLREVLKLNDFENVRVGIGLTTGQAKPLQAQKRLELGAHAGFGYRDKTWKYGGYALWRITRNGQTRLLLDCRRDLLEPGALYELNRSTIVDRALYATRMDRSDELTVSLSSRLGRYLWLQSSFRRQTLRPTYAYQFGTPDTGFDDRFDFAESTLYLRYANGEKTRTFLGDDVGSVQRLPVLELAYTHGWRGLWQGEYSYHRWAAALYHSFFIRRLGRTSWRIEAGLVSADAPLAKLFTLNQSGTGGWNLFLLPNTFQALPDTLFLADRFANLYLSQEIGPVLYKNKHSAPFLILLQNVAWGNLRQPQLHQQLGFRTASTPLLESGIQLDNLLRVNYVNIAYLGLGGAVFYRWGGLGDSNWEKNVSFRLTLKLSL
ncbi:MAG: carboxypeptidase-like regulatory domain-containing protein [Saprospiraceae bacterium]|nr:carboxypeptidase-like regulatory domain-containing protein [Saprospiraceae bacterium]